MKYAFTFLFFCTFFFAVAQTTIKSIQFRPLAQNNTSNILALGSAFELSFDDLEADQKDYYYKIEHMTYDWAPSTIFPNEYIEGFQENAITKLENSFNTLQNYTNYRVQFPNNNTRITKSGNYLLSVLNDVGEVVFSRRFTLYQNKTTVGARVVRSRNTLTRNQKQTVNFTINYNENSIQNPTQEVRVVVLQNNNWATAISNLKPQFFKRNQLVYTYVGKPDFWSGNEYLNFDNKQIRNSTVQIAKVEQKEIFHSYLYTQSKRNKAPYTYFPDINGQFIIRTIEATDTYTEADYARVHFSLKSDNRLEKEVHVYGAFNNFKMTPETRMTYNNSNQNYEVSLVLKQGFYNYTFATKEENTQANLHELNGSFFETENEYNVLVYQKAFGQNYYQAIGLGTAVANPQDN